jgi:polysaccharide export outer membrane protein
MTFRKIIWVLLLFSVSACTPLEELVYLQDKEADEDTVSVPPVITIPEYTLIIKISDVLSIQLFTINAEAFPGIASTIDKQTIDNRSQYEKGFIVDSNGKVDLPLIGSVKLEGLSILEAKELLVREFEKYMDDPVVVLKHLSFKITILGEVRNPGLYYVENEKITILEALGLAGDLTYYGNREEVKVIRKVDDVYKEILIDLTGKDMLTSQVAFLHPDDVVYVKPLKKRNFANLAPIVAIVTSIVVALTLVLTVMIQANR